MMFNQLKERLFQWLLKRCPEQIEYLAEQALRKLEAIDRARVDSSRFELVYKQIGKPCIYVSNEWGNPVVGYGVKVEDFGRTEAWLVVHDYISGQDVIPFGKRLDYNPQRLELVLNLTPWELCELLHDHTEGFQDKPKLNVRDSATALMERLTTNGFFECLKEHKE